jgi:hypothetical protein
MQVTLSGLLFFALPSGPRRFLRQFSWGLQFEVLLSWEDIDVSISTVHLSLQLLRNVQSHGTLITVHVSEQQIYAIPWIEYRIDNQPIIASPRDPSEPGCSPAAPTHQLSPASDQIWLRCPIPNTTISRPCFGCGTNAGRA